MGREGREQRKRREDGNDWEEGRTEDRSEGGKKLGEYSIRYNSINT